MNIIKDGWKIIGAMKWRNSDYLFTVLAQENDSARFCVWTYNSKDEGFSNGEYKTIGDLALNQSAAYSCFIGRCSDHS